MKLALSALLLGIALLMPMVSAQSYCSDASTMAYNKTYNISGTITPFAVEENCPLGCDVTRGVCQQPMGTPIEIYLFFEIVAFASLAGSFWTAKKTEDVMLIFPIMACMLFFILGYLGGTLLINGTFVVSMLSIWMNFALALMCLVLIFYNLVADFGRKPGRSRGPDPEFQ